jgi:hypothetical protein
MKIYLQIFLNEGDLMDKVILRFKEKKDVAINNQETESQQNLHEVSNGIFQKICMAVSLKKSRSTTDLPTKSIQLGFTELGLGSLPSRHYRSAEALQNPYLGQCSR